MAPRAGDANMTRSEVRLQMRPLQNLSRKTGGLKKEMKCAEKKTTPKQPNKLLHNLLGSENKIPSVRNSIFLLLAGKRHVSCLRASSRMPLIFRGHQWSRPVTSEATEHKPRLSKPSSTLGVCTRVPWLHGLAKALRV